MKNSIITLMASVLLFGCSDNRQTLQLYSWSDYIDMAVLMDFENEYNCNVIVTTFDSNEAAYAKLKAGASGYDVMIPSSYMIETLASEGIIEQIDHSKIPNVISNFCHKFDSQISDSNLTYGVPYLVTYGGLMYNKNKVSLDENMSWKQLMETKSKFSLLDDIRETIGIGLMANGFSINSENEKEIEMAVETILAMKRNVRKFDAESYKTEVTNGSLDFGHGYSTDANQVIIGEEEGCGRDDIGFVLPKEGFSIAFDEMVVMKDSENKDLAHKFIDFMYRPENSLKNMVYCFSPTPNEKAIEMLPENYKKVIILPEEIMTRGQTIKNFSNSNTADLYSGAWDKIRAIGR